MGNADVDLINGIMQEHVLIAMLIVNIVSMKQVIAYFVTAVIYQMEQHVNVH